MVLVPDTNESIFSTMVLPAFKRAQHQLKTKPNPVWFRLGCCFSGCATSSAAKARSTKERPNGTSGYRWVSHMSTDGLKDGQRKDRQVERMEEARVELEDKSATLLAEIKHRVLLLRRNRSTAMR